MGIDLLGAQGLPGDAHRDRRQGRVQGGAVKMGFHLERDHPEEIRAGDQLAHQFLEPWDGAQAPHVQGQSQAASYQEVIGVTFGVEYRPSTVWHILRAMGWSCQKPERRARERDEQAIATWRQQDWPRIKKRRKKRAKHPVSG